MLEISLVKDYMVRDVFAMIDNRKALYQLYPQYLRPYSAYINKECIRKIFEYVYKKSFYVVKRKERILGFFCLCKNKSGNYILPFIIGEYRHLSYRNVIRCIFDFCLRKAKDEGADTIIWESFPYLSWFYSYTQEIGFKLCGHDVFLCEKEFGENPEVLYRFRVNINEYLNRKVSQKLCRKYNYLDCQEVSRNGK